MSGGPLEALLKEQVRFNGIVLKAMNELKASQARIVGLVENLHPGDLVAPSQSWRPILDDTPIPDAEVGCEECVPRVPASAQSEGYVCKACGSRYAPKLGEDGKWRWLWQ